MEKTTATKHIAVIESCSMSAMGLKHLFAMPALSHYQVHLFARFDNFKAALSEISFFAVIYSLSDEREERRNCLACLRISPSPTATSSVSCWPLMKWRRDWSAIFRLLAYMELSVNRFR